MSEIKQLFNAQKRFQHILPEYVGVAFLQKGNISKILLQTGMTFSACFKCDFSIHMIQTHVKEGVHAVCGTLYNPF